MLSEELIMFFVPDNTDRCGLYNCRECGARFLDLSTEPEMVCPYCGEPYDMEEYFDEDEPEPKATAVLAEVIEGAEEVEKYDTLLSLAQTGGDYGWL